jgi:hypothetical protein
MTRLQLPTERLAAILLAAICVLTLVWPDWIEGLFGLDSDAGSGAAEAALVCVCALGAAALWFHQRLVRGAPARLPRTPRRQRRRARAERTCPAALGRQPVAGERRRAGVNEA